MHFSPVGRGEVFGLLEKAQGAKGVQHKKSIPQTFPGRLLGHRAPQNLTEFLWRDPSDKLVPYQLREPDHKLWTALTAARLNLAHHLATTTTVAKAGD